MNLVLPEHFSEHKKKSISPNGKKKTHDFLAKISKDIRQFIHRLKKCQNLATLDKMERFFKMAPVSAEDDFVNKIISIRPCFLKTHFNFSRTG